MADTGWLSPASITQVADGTGGDRPWTNLDNAEVEDGNCATFDWDYPWHLNINLRVWTWKMTGSGDVSAPQYFPNGTLGFLYQGSSTELWGQTPEALKTAMADPAFGWAIQPYYWADPPHQTGGYFNSLWAKDFGIALPTLAFITGVEVAVKLKADYANPTTVGSVDYMALKVYYDKKGPTPLSIR